MKKAEAKRSFLGITSLSFGLLGWLLLFVIPNLSIFIEKVSSFRWCILLFWCMALILGILALYRIRAKKTQHRKRTKAIIGIWISAIPLLLYAGILLISHTVWPGFPFPRQRPFSECDPNKVIALIENSFDFHLPDNISSAKAAETRTSWLEHNYIFILSFTTDLEGWDQFHTSFPKIKDHNTTYTEVDGREYIHDMYDFMDYEPNEDELRIEPFWGWPKWFKAKIKKGKYFSGYLNSKDRSLQIDTLCIDLGDPEKVVIYIDCWGSYDTKYGLD